MADYKQKYLKYKIKYLNLIGGNYKCSDNEDTNILNKLCVKDKKGKYITKTECVTSKECTDKWTHSKKNNILWLRHLLTIIRNDPTYYKIENDELIIKAFPGKLWFDNDKHIFNSTYQLPKNIMIFKDFSLNTKNINFKINLNFTPTLYGNQAGIILYISDLDYIKLVIEGNKTGGNMLMFSIQENKISRKIYKIETIEITPYFKLEININNNIITAKFNDNLLENNITIPTQWNVNKLYPGLMAYSTEKIFDDKEFEIDKLDIATFFDFNFNNF